MTNEEAKEWLKAIKEKYIHGGDEGFDAKRKEAISMAIKALDREPCGDAISRQAVLDLAQKGFLVSNGNYESVCKAINDLPSVNPQEPKADVLDKIRAEIDEQYDRVHPYNISCAEGLEMALEIIDKYKAESEEV